MRLIKALLHLHSKQSPGKLNYKSFIGRRSVRVFCFTLSMSGSCSVLLEAMRQHRRFLYRGWEAEREAGYAESFLLPLTTYGSCQVEPSSFKFPSCLPPPFVSWGSPAFIKPPPPLSFQTQPRYPCQIHWRQPEEVNGANRFSAFTVVVLRQGRQTQLNHGQPKTTLFFFNLKHKYKFLASNWEQQLNSLFLHTFGQDLFRCNKRCSSKLFFFQAEYKKTKQF